MNLAILRISIEFPTFAFIAVVSSGDVERQKIRLDEIYASAEKREWGRGGKNVTFALICVFASSGPWTVEVE